MVNLSNTVELGWLKLERTQNVFELSEVRATEVPRKKYLKSCSDGRQFHNAMMNNWYPGQWFLEMKKIYLIL